MTFLISVVVLNYSISFSAEEFSKFCFLDKSTISFGFKTFTLAPSSAIYCQIEGNLPEKLKFLNNLGFFIEKKFDWFSCGQILEFKIFSKFPVKF